MLAWIQQAELLSLDLDASDDVGRSVAIQGDLAVVGAPGDDNGFGNDGAAYVFKRTGTTWSQIRKLTASDSVNSDQFGASVAIDDDLIVVGAPGDDRDVPFVSNTGSAYVFKRDSLDLTLWNQVAKLEPTQDGGESALSLAFEQFGLSVAVDNGTIVVGARQDDTFSPTLANVGAAYVYGSSYTLTHKLRPAVAGSGDQFGTSVAISGGTLVIGSDLDDEGAFPDAGSAYVFSVAGSQLARLTSDSHAASGAGFGTSVAIDGGTIVVGAAKEPISPTSLDVGAAYVFNGGGSSWSAPNRITAADRAAGDGFGKSVDIQSNIIVVGADGDNFSPTAPDVGAVYVFEQSGGWLQSAKLTPADLNSSLGGDALGASVGIDAGFVVAGAPGHDHGATNTGSAYVFIDRNSAPAGMDKALTILEDTPYPFMESDFGYSDPNDIPPDALLAVKISSLPSAGSLTVSGNPVVSGQFVSAASIAAGELVFTPAANANGGPYAGFTFQVQDNGGTANGGVDLDPSANTITIDVTPVNDPPAGTDNAVTMAEDTVYTFATADFGFGDPNDSPANMFAAVNIAALPNLGTLSNNFIAVTAGDSISVGDIAANKLRFVPAANGNGTPYASFMFKVQDDGGTANGGIDLDPVANTIAFDVTSVNDPPAGTDTAVATPENTPYAFAIADFGFSDPNDNPANALAAVIIGSLPMAGTLTNNSSPVAAGDSVSAGDIQANRLVFTPDSNTSGPGYASFVFQVRDDGGGDDLDLSANTITIDVTSANHAPAGMGAVITIAEDTLAYTFVEADFGFSDPLDNPPDGFLAVKITTLPGQGVLTFNGDPVLAGDFVLAADIAAGGLKFAPDANENGAPYASFTFQVQDDGGVEFPSDQNLDQSPSAMTINVTAVNDVPTAFAQSTAVTEDGQVMIVLTGDDLETAPEDLTFKIMSLPSKGVLKVNGVPIQLFDTLDGDDTLVFQAGVSCDCLGATDAFDFVVIDGGDPDPTPGNQAASAPATVSVLITQAVAAGQAVLTDGILRVAGTGGGDNIKVFSDGATVTVIINSATTTYVASAVQEVRIWARAGNDIVQLLFGFTIDSMIHGGAGGDLLTGGNADDLIFGDDDFDTINGGNGDDFLVGGTGNDRISGNNGHDILVAGEIACHFTEEMLRDISAAWALEHEVDEDTEPVLEDIEPDDDFDRLTGGNGSDWFIINPGDQITDFGHRRNKDDDAITVVGP